MSLFCNGCPKALLKALIHHEQLGTGVQITFFSLILALKSSDTSALEPHHETNEFPDFWQI